jgi:hypothetical protein
MKYAQGSIITNKANVLVEPLTPRKMNDAPMAEMMNGDAKNANVQAKKTSAYGTKKLLTAKNTSSTIITNVKTLNMEGKVNFAQLFRAFIVVHVPTVYRENDVP